MDPISAMFASYLDAISSNVAQHTSDVLGTEIQAQVVEHQGVQVPYTYQLWKIQPKSVCESYRGNIDNYSHCTSAAKSLFADTCEYLQQHPGDGWKHRKLKNMYCMAAVSYQPTVATIGWSSEEASPLEEARAACNLAIAELVGNTDPAARRRKQAACDTYDSLKAGK
jgi:hypothetical protein